MRLTLPAALLVLLAACLERPYHRAAQADTVDAYRAYLAEHRHEAEADLARDRLAQLEFERARAAHSVVGYKRFLEEFPDSVQALKAQPLLETLRFNATRDAGTPQALRQFLADHPDGAHRSEAQRLLVEAERARAERSGATAELERFVANHPEDPARGAIEETLDRAAFDRAAAGGPAQLYAYLKTHPAGAHRHRAQALLFEARIAGLLASGRLSEARAEIARSPLAAQLPSLAARLASAEEEEQVRSSRDAAVRASLARSYLRSLDQLELGLRDPDAQVRWEAADELGHHVDVRAIEPLLAALGSGRNPLVRERALASLSRVLSALPKEVARYEVATRVEALERTASSPELLLRLAVLHDLSANLERAAPEYQRAYDPAAPDPLVLHRWIDVRLGRGQAFSAAVAARQLAIWAEQTAREFDAGAESGVTLQAARMLCAAQAMAHKAAWAIDAARAAQTEFPDDVAQFERAARGARKLVEARLSDVELALKVQLPEARPCADRALEERLAGAERARLEALRSAQAAAPRLARALRQLAARDPSERVRALADAQLAAPPPP